MLASEYEFSLKFVSQLGMKVRNLINRYRFTREIPELVSLSQHGAQNGGGGWGLLFSLSLLRVKASVPSIAFQAGPLFTNNILYLIFTINTFNKN